MLTITCPSCLRELQMPSASPEKEWECPRCGAKFSGDGRAVEIPAPAQPTDGESAAESQRADETLTARAPSVEEASSEPLWEPPKRVSTLTRRIFRDADRAEVLRSLNFFGVATLLAFGLFIWGAFTVSWALLCLGVFAAPCLGAVTAFVVECFYILIKGEPPRDEESGAYEISRRLQKRPGARRSPFDSHFGEAVQSDSEGVQEQSIPTSVVPSHDELPPIGPTETPNTNVRPE